MNIPEFNTHCKAYEEAFSPRRNVGRMGKFDVLTKRAAAVNCITPKEHLQVGSRAPVVHSGENKPLANLAKKDISTPGGVAKLNEEGIEIALDRRVALFFQQAILCHGVSTLVFSAKGADGQIGTSPAQVVGGEKYKREAAHSSTTPALIARLKGNPKAKPFVYFKGGSSHDQHNATVGMHESVNGTDELIDGKGNDGKLREAAVALFNETAQGLSPVEATQKFIKAFSERVKVVEGSLDKKDQRQAVLKLYLQKIELIRKASEKKGFCDGLIGAIIYAGGADEKVQREVIYKKRYDMIRKQEIVEANIGKKIADAKDLLPKREQSLLEHALLKDFSETKQRLFLEKLFGKTLAFLEKSAPDKTLKAFQTKVANFQAKHKVVLDKLKGDLRSEFRELSCAEMTYRSGLFKGLRTDVKDWTQKAFLQKYLSATGRKISQAWVSRLEQLSHAPAKIGYVTPINQRRKYISMQDAKDYAKTFGVDAGSFFPCLFTSS